MRTKPGFRFSIIDGAFLVLSAVGIYGMWIYDPMIAVVFAMPVFAFFCFCNVFRVRRAPEIVWALSFPVLAFTGFMLQMELIIAVMGSMLMMVAIVVREMAKPWYHGIFWKSVNPDVAVVSGDGSCQRNAIGRTRQAPGT